MILRRTLIALLVFASACSATGQTVVSAPSDSGALPTTTVLTLTTDAVEQVSWAVSGYDLRQGVEPYPWGSPHGLDIDPTDETGLHLYERDGVRYLHPVGQGQYVLMMLNSYNLTGDPEFLDRALLNLDSLLAFATEVDGALFFPYTFDFPLYGLEELNLEAPWWSGMAQGQILSALVRAYEATGEQRYRDATDAVVESFAPRPISDWPVSEPVVTFIDEGGYLWFEEYSGNLEPAYVLNGHLFALFGLYDYWEMTGSDEVALMIDGAATAVAHYLPQFRNEPGQLSWYGLTIKPNERGLHAKYHRIHQEQLRTLAEMTGEKLFSDYADLLKADTPETDS